MSDLSADVRKRMEQIRREHPDGNYPTPLHDPSECTECEALYALIAVAPETKSDTIVQTMWDEVTAEQQRRKAAQ